MDCMASRLLNTLLVVLVIDGVYVSIIPEAVNDMWVSMKDSLNDMVDCMSNNRTPTLEDVNFYVFTPHNRDKPEEIKLFQINKSRHFNNTLNTKVLIHGYTQSYKNELFIKMKDVYVNMGHLNVIMVNWENLANSPCYPIASDYTDFVGQVTGYFLKQLQPEKIHIIGFSLGAHVAAIAGGMQNKTLSRITGLDPAFPMFIKCPLSKRLDINDAQNIDVIHSSIVGYPTPIGHADFFPNGGSIQPGCGKTNVSCCHTRGLELYVESITTKRGFKTRMCTSFNDYENKRCFNNTFIYMGEPWFASGATRGMFYLKTNSTSPYAIEERLNV